MAKSQKAPGEEITVQFIFEVRMEFKERRDHTRNGQANGIGGGFPVTLSRHIEVRKESKPGFQEIIFHKKSFS